MARPAIESRRITGNYCDENVGDDQAIAEGPHEAVAEPGDQADEEIDCGEEGQEGQESGEWDCWAEQKCDTREDVESDDCGGDYVQRRGAAQEND